MNIPNVESLMSLLSREQGVWVRLRFMEGMDKYEASAFIEERIGFDVEDPDEMESSIFRLLRDGV